MGFIEKITDKIDSKITSERAERDMQNIARALSDESFISIIINNLGLFYLRFVCQRLDIANEFKSADISGDEYFSDLYSQYAAGEISFNNGHVFNLEGVDITSAYPLPRLISEIIPVLSARFNFFPVIDKNISLTHHYVQQGCAVLNIKDYHVDIKSLLNYASNVFYEIIAPGIINNFDSILNNNKDIVAGYNIETIRKYFNIGLCNTLFNKISDVYNMNFDKTSHQEWSDAYERYSNDALEQSLNLVKNLEANDYDAYVINEAIRPFEVPLGFNFVWDLNNISECGLLLDKSKNLVEPNIFSGDNISNLKELDHFLYDVFNELSLTKDKDFISYIREHELEIMGGTGYLSERMLIPGDANNPGNAIYNHFYPKKSNRANETRLHFECHLWESDKKRFAQTPFPLSLLLYP